MSALIRFWLFDLSGKLALKGRRFSKGYVNEGRSLMSEKPFFCGEVKRGLCSRPRKKQPLHNGGQKTFDGLRFDYD